MTYPKGGASQIWRDGTGAAHRPLKSEIREWGTNVEDRIVGVETVATSGYEYTSGGPVATATTANITLSGEQTLDGVLTSASRVLVKDQTSPAENGVYVTASGAWARATDMDAASEVQATAVYVSAGTVNGGKTFVTYSAVTTLGSDAISFVETASNGGVQGQIDANTQATKVDLAQAVPWLTVVPDGVGGYIIPSFEWDVDNGRVWLNGRVMTVAEAMTDNGDGSFSLNEIPAGISAGVTMFAEWSTAGHTGTPSGKYMGMLANATSLVGEVAMGTYNHAASGTLGVQFENRNSSPVSTDQATGWGVNRAANSVPASGNQLRKIEGSPVVTDSATATYTTPTAVMIGGWPRNAGRDPLTNVSIKHAIIYSEALTETQLETLFDLTDPDYGLDQAVIPHWVPRVPHESLPGYRYADLAFDYSRGRCWFNGRERAFEDVFVDAAGGDFTLIKPPRGLTTSTGITYGADIRRTDFYDATQTPSGFAFNALLASGVSSLAERLEFEITTQNIPGASGAPVEPGGLANTTGFVAKAGVTIPLASDVSANGGFVSRGQGIYRYGVSVPASGAVLTFSNAGSVKSNASVASYVPQDWFRFGAKVDGTSPIQNASVVQGFIFSKSLSVAQMNALKTFNEYGMRPLLFIGDSINNVQQPAEMLALHLANDGMSYVPWWSQGKGGRGVNYLSELITEIVTFDDSFRDYVLIMVEGGFDYSSLALDGVTTVDLSSDRVVLSYLSAIRDEFREPLWVWMESNSNLVAETDIAGGVTTGMTQWQATQDRIRETYPAAFCGTMGLMKAQAQTDAEYDAIIVDGRIATHLRGDGIHFPWGTAYSGDAADASGYYWWSRALQLHLAEFLRPQS